MSINKSSFKNINSPNTTCPGCMENQKNRFAHIIPGGCMFKLESGVDWVQDPEENKDIDINNNSDINTENEYDTNNSDEEYDKYNSNQPTDSTYSYCIDINKSGQQKKDTYQKQELFFDMDDFEIFVPENEYNNYVNDPCKFTN